MARDVPTSEPTTLVAGTSWQWDKTLSDFLPSDGWVLTYYVLGLGKTTPITAAANAENTGHEVRQAGSVSLDYSPGTYELVGLVNDGTDEFEVYRSALTLEAHPSAVASRALHDEAVWKALQAAIEGRATRDQEQVTVNGREIQRIPLAELVRLEAQYRRRVRNARTPDRRGNRYGVRFGQPA